MVKPKLFYANTYIHLQYNVYLAIKAYITYAHTLKVKR